MMTLSYASWMYMNYDRLKDIPVNRITVPGTHNAGAYILDYDHPAQYPSLSIVAKLFPSIRRGLKAWTVTQSDTVYKQLTAGIRYLDIRISYRRKDHTFYVTHTITCIPLIDFLKQVQRFYAENPKEFLLFDIAVDYENRNIMTPELQGESWRIMKTYLLDLFLRRNNTYPTYNDIVVNKPKIIAYYKEYPFDDVLLWNRQHLFMPWKPIQNVEEKYAYLVKNLQYAVESNYNGMSFTITPTGKTIGKDLAKRFFLRCIHHNTGLQPRTIQLQEKLPDFLELNVSNVSTFITDFPTFEFIQQVILLNFQEIEN